jgi:hypothetical protein
MSLPPPPPDYAPPKTRPSAVTKYAIIGLIASILFFVIAAVDFLVFPGTASYFLGAIMIFFGVFFLIVTFGFFAGQAWALSISGYSHTQWANTPEVRAYFGLPPAYSPYPQTAAAPPPPTCPTCGQPLMLVQQYNRWYCSAEQKYV